eukprot:scaffold178157_cov33-Prasinocladus_malaysianus.AAC.1
MTAVLGKNPRLDPYRLFSSATITQRQQLTPQATQRLSMASKAVRVYKMANDGPLQPCHTRILPSAISKGRPGLPWL